VAVARSLPIDDGPSDLVAALGEGLLERSDERAEVGTLRPRVHLRDEQDPQYEPGG
jgi:hypothetical protein